MPDPNSTYGSLFSPEGCQTRFSASSIRDWQKCPRYYFYTWIAGWRLDTGESVHLTFGAHYAKALQTFYLRLAAGDDREAALRHCVRRLLEWTWDDERGEPWNPESEGLSKAEIKNRRTLIRTFVWYVDEWKDDVEVWRLGDGSPAVELKFEVDLDTNVSLVGTLDRVCVSGDHLLIMDQKTTGSTISGYYFDAFDLNVQMDIYIFAGQTAFSTEISGVLVDAAQIAAGFSRFVRQPTYRTAAQTEEFLDELMDSTIPAIRKSTGDWAASTNTPHDLRRLFPRNFSSCSMYGRCMFFDVCRKSPEVQMNFLRNRFTRAPSPREAPHEAPSEAQP